MVLDGKLVCGTLKFRRKLKNKRSENRANSGSCESHCVLYGIIVTAANQVGLLLLKVLKKKYWQLMRYLVCFSLLLHYQGFRSVESVKLFSL